MIVRAILQNPDLANNFDFYNDFKDTYYWLLKQTDHPNRFIACDELVDAGLNTDISTPAIVSMVKAITDKVVARRPPKQPDTAQQIDQLRNTLTNIQYHTLSIHNGALPNHLTVLQCDQNGDTHELLLNITYIENCDEAHTQGNTPMAICKWCQNEITNSLTTCTGNKTVEFPGGTNMPSIPYKNAEGYRCHDCNIANGGNHHPGCDMERCPKCGGQLISCGCLDTPE